MHPNEKLHFSAIINPRFFYHPLKRSAITPAAISDLLGVVYEGVVRVDEEDVLRLQVSVSQLVVMENCRGNGREVQMRKFIMSRHTSNVVDCRQLDVTDLQQRIKC